MGNIPSVDSKNLPCQQTISERRNLRFNQPDPAFRLFYSDQYCRSCGRGSNKEFAQFLQIAIGSAYELDYQILLAKDLEYIDKNIYTELSGEVTGLQKQIAALLKKVRASC